jgi:hypothetical protein
MKTKNDKLSEIRQKNNREYRIMNIKDTSISEKCKKSFITITQFTFFRYDR